ncbi:helix-turn-helix domain-containing protein [Poseidonibacter lekithochrous]|uniref:helix-turn-helix domain-containing protein n=1 Tax=Poseidonibacter lekithochrous TaxID=1904463 RepID=UPI0008FCA2BA|nr:helix-turn-helix transcriptional regulator [Poseidonibacter lekithochrous]QKJ22309.1 hypothetical protein ALEK_1029 [Poseidonibacter lekithochrous]
MTKFDFNYRLKELGLTLRDFSDISNVSYSTINNWGFEKDDGKKIAIPVWVEPFLDNYEKAKKYDYLKKEIFDVMKEIEK